MSELRNQLQSLRATYEEQTYDGDLGQDIRSGRRSWKHWGWLASGFGIGSLAAAAAVMFAVSRVGLPQPVTTPAAQHLLVAADQRLNEVGLTPPPVGQWTRELGLDEYRRIIPPAIDRLRTWFSAAQTTPSKSESDQQPA